MRVSTSRSLSLNNDVQRFISWMHTSVQQFGMSRKYELRKRAEKREETRRRIVEAAIGLHASIGPARTTISGIAERAGVQRHTVYAHFPDERELHVACSGLYLSRNPLPDAAPWREVADPQARLRRGLGDLYEWFAANEALLSRVVADAETHVYTREMAE